MDVSLTEKACVKATLWVGISVEPTKVDLLEVLECYNSTVIESSKGFSLTLCWLDFFFLGFFHW